MVSLRLSTLGVLCAMLFSQSISVLAGPAPGPLKQLKRSSTPPGFTSSTGKMFNNPNFAPPSSKQVTRMFEGFVPPPANPAAAALVHNMTTTLAKRAVPGAPHWVIYSDAWNPGQVGPPNPSAISGFNTFILSFLLVAGPADQAVAWAQLSADQRSSIKAAYNAAGISLMVAAFGATDEPTSRGTDPVGIANRLADWVIQYGLDGVDIDYEDFTAINRQDGSAENWLISLTRQLRFRLPAGQYIITHAPVAPWFSKAKYPTGAYATVHAQVGNLIDWYNIQFYNQGTSEYTTCSGLFDASSSLWPNTAIFQLSSSLGIPLSKLVVGKPATTGDANNGYIAPSTLAGCLQSAKARGWNGGAMFWQYPNGGAALAQTVRSLSWPVSGNPPPTTTTKGTTSTPTPTGGQGCGGVSAWVSNIAYTGGQKVSYNGRLWTAKWWTQAEVPGGSSGVWTDSGSC